MGEKRPLEHVHADTSAIGLLNATLLYWARRRGFSRTLLVRVGWKWDGLCVEVSVEGDRVTYCWVLDKLSIDDKGDGFYIRDVAM